MNQALNPKSNRIAFWSLIVVVGMGIGMLVISLSFKLSAPEPDVMAVASQTTESTPDEGMPSALIVNRSQIEPTEFYAEPDAMEVPEAEQEDTASEEQEFIRQAQRQQVQYLQEVLPDSLMIPTEKTDQEVEQMMAEMELHRSLQQKLQDDTATQEERNQYAALHRQKLEEEKALIHLCEDVSANSLEEDSVKRTQLCTHMAESAPERLQVIEEILQQLDQGNLLTGLE